MSKADRKQGKPNGQAPQPLTVLRITLGPNGRVTRRFVKLAPGSMPV